MSAAVIKAAAKRKTNEQAALKVSSGAGAQGKDDLNRTLPRDASKEKAAGARPSTHSAGSAEGRAPTITVTQAAEASNCEDPTLRRQDDSHISRRASEESLTPIAREHTSRNSLRKGRAGVRSLRSSAFLKRPRGLFYFQFEAQMLYSHPYVQWTVAGLIGANFLTNIVEKQIDPLAEKYVAVWDVFEYFYNIVFAIELAINMYAYWCRPFWASGWNIFDFLVVSIGLLFMCELPLPPSFALLRMLRAFRVFRLFKRVKELNKILQAIARAVPGMSYAFVVLTLVMAIYAILAVEFFGQLGPVKDDGVRPKHGDEYFGNFMRSLYTMFQVLTGESWSEGVARPMLFPREDPVACIGTAIFFVSFILVNGVVLLNVVLANLLENFVVRDTPAFEENERVEICDHVDSPELNGRSARIVEKDADKAGSWICALEPSGRRVSVPETCLELLDEEDPNATFRNTLEVAENDAWALTQSLPPNLSFCEDEPADPEVARLSHEVANLRAGLSDVRGEVESTLMLLREVLREDCHAEGAHGPLEDEGAWRLPSQPDACAK